MSTEDAVSRLWGPWSCEAAEGLPLPDWAQSPSTSAAGSLLASPPLTVFEAIKEIKRKVILCFPGKGFNSSNRLSTGPTGTVR